MPIGLRRRRRDPRREYVTQIKQISFDATKEIPNLIEYFTDDWIIVNQIIATTVVILILEKEVEEGDEANATN